MNLSTFFIHKTSPAQKESSQIILRDWAKGMLLNLLYEGHAIFYKWWLFCIGFFVVQLAIGVRAVQQIPCLYASQNKTMVSLYASLQETFMPYLFIAALLFAVVGSTAYLFWKDTIKAQPYYTLRMLPVPRSCSFGAKYLCILCSVVSVYLTQFLVFMALLCWPFANHQFRADEWLLSVSDGGFLIWFFPPDIRMLFVVSFLLLLVTIAFVNGLFFAGRISKNYIAPILGVVAIAFIAVNGIQNLSVIICCVVSVLLVVAAILCLWDAYRNY